MVSAIQNHLVDAGYNFVTANDNFVVVQDPRWSNYRVYSTEIDPDNYHNTHIDAPNMVFEFVSQAQEYIA